MSNSATEHVVHGWRSYIDYDKSRGNRRQLLVSNLTATVLTNFLAVFLAIAAKGFYNIARRILRLRTQRRKSGIQYIDASQQSLTGLNASLATPTAHAPNSPIIALPGNALMITPRQAGDQTTEAQESHRVQLERLEMIDAAPDPGTLSINTFGRFLSRLRRLEPLRPLGDTRPIYRRMLTLTFWSNMSNVANEDSTDLLWNFLIALGAFALYFGSMLLSIMSAYPVVGDTVGLSNHSQCGVFAVNTSAINDPLSNALGRQFYHEIARESRQYAKSCYEPARGTNSTPNPESCSFFYKPRIDYTIIDNDACPFRTLDTHMCLDGEKGAYTVTTGSMSSEFMVDASTIGVNSLLQYKFHRSITCSPLTREGFIHGFGVNDSITSLYFYGNNTGGSRCRSTHRPNCTLEIQMKSITLDASTYSMYTVSTSGFSIRPDIWHPLFEVNTTRGKVATLILISNNGVFYPRQVLDPIFPASIGTGDWYYNGVFRAGVLGCMTKTLVCLPSKVPRPCYSLEDLINLDSSDVEHISVRTMLYISLIPDLDQLLFYLKSNALDVQSLLSGSTSEDISDKQWKVEVRQMFETLLARTQIEARNIARGAPGIKRVNEQMIMRFENPDICERYKLRTVGWSNISVSHFLVEFLLGLTICILGITRENKELWFEEPMKRMAKIRWKELCVSAVVKAVVVIDVCVSPLWKGILWTTGFCWPRNRRGRRRLL